jgi:hypothetical protein
MKRQLLDPALLHTLATELRPGVEELSELIDRDLRGWLQGAGTGAGSGLHPVQT